MEQKVYDTYVAILKNELKVALGCTEPIAIAYVGAKVREVLGKMPEHIDVYCSGNIVKNVKAVVVPNSDGQRGIDVAAALGVIGGDASLELAVLESVKPEDIQLCKKLLQENFVDTHLVEDVANLYVSIKATAGDESAEVEVKEHHSNITKIVKNGEVIFTKEEENQQPESNEPDKTLLKVKDILEFADTVKIDDVKELLDRQIQYNTAIAR